MQKLLLIILLIIGSKMTLAQYTYRGKVVSEIRQQPLTDGTIKLLSNERKRQRYPIVATIDNTGHFSATLKDSVVTLIVDCSLAGSTAQRVTHTDTVIVFVLKAACNEFNIKKAELDIDNGHPLLLCYLGYATYLFSDADRAFEKKYGISYRTSADEPLNSDCMWLYNKTVAAWLDKKFGTEWRNEVRWDINLAR